jgi:hypothetical protein
MYRIAVKIDTTWIKRRYIWLPIRKGQAGHGRAEEERQHLGVCQCSFVER